MEHISRGILPSVDTIILVSDCSRRGVQAVGRIAKLIPECGLKPKMVGLIVNRAPGGVLNEGTKEEIEKQGLRCLASFPRTSRSLILTAREGRPSSFRRILRCARPCIRLSTGWIFHSSATSEQVGSPRAGPPIPAEKPDKARGQAFPARRPRNI